MKEIFQKENKDGWIYYIDSAIAWIPMYCQGTLLWLKRYWMTWPEKDGKPILFKDMDFCTDKNGPLANQEMYKAYFPYDPRKRE